MAQQLGPPALAAWGSAGPTTNDCTRARLPAKVGTRAGAHIRPRARAWCRCSEHSTRDAWPSLLPQQRNSSCQSLSPSLSLWL